MNEWMVEQRLVAKFQNVSVALSKPRHREEPATARPP
jgi:hypothetical protein